MSDETVAEEADKVEEQPEVKEPKVKANAAYYKEQLSAYQKKMAELEEHNNQIKSDLDRIQKTQLEKEKNYEALWKAEEQKRIAAEEKAKKISESYFNGLKRSAIEQEALKEGIIETALEDLGYIDNSMVQIETTNTGNVNVLGAKDLVLALRERKPHWFKMQGAPTINNANAEYGKKDLSAKEILALQKKDPAKYKEHILRMVKNK